jgi:hypothetical protein
MRRNLEAMLSVVEVTNQHLEAEDVKLEFSLHEE